MTDTITHIRSVPDLASSERAMHLFDAEVAKNGQKYETLSLLIQRFSKHVVNGKKVIIITCCETTDNDVQEFFNIHAHKVVEVSLNEYDREGEATGVESLLCTVKSMGEPFEAGKNIKNPILFKEILLCEV